MSRKIIIDTDPGQDDAVAILLALASPEELEVLGVVAVAGNVGLHHNANNARKVVELAGRRDIHVYAGCARPMRRHLVTAEHVHGETGLDGPDLPDPTIPLQTQHGVDYIVDTLMAAEPGTITLCTLGPLTNIAMALIKQPAIAERIKEIVMMGGAYFEVGNITPAAEFNIYVDPEAADVVLRSGVPITMLPLDVTHQIQSTPQRLAAIKAIGNKSGEAVHAMLTFSETFDLQKYGWSGAPLHDPTVIAYLLQPDLFTGRHCNVTIETASELTVGMTVTDYWHVTGKVKNVNYLRNGNAEGFYKLLTERLARLP
ncbi:nucleoside hydrolase [Devosia psychrophila]|jgi:purine nucleosidase|uniref:Nucleoside hydrolase n=1 Tax=Devosia psychrophila TaxID=728005 RepID=A0A0F5Q1X8_9HYPH|nr:nucleoside hydrolase [Devosia psychrophila]KKC34927.1 nucleoside hydrolase [Devosia psychrophila]SFD08088.1 purine nucleosidase [Devosia psychrophila]